jgi:hypothetical protein
LERDFAEDFRRRGRIGRDISLGKNPLADLISVHNSAAGISLSIPAARRALRNRHAAAFSDQAAEPEMHLHRVRDGKGKEITPDAVERDGSQILILYGL